MLLWLLVSCVPWGCRAQQELGLLHLPFLCQCTEGDMPPVRLPIGQQLCFVAAYRGFKILHWYHMEKQDCTWLACFAFFVGFGFLMPLLQLEKSSAALLQACCQRRARVHAYRGRCWDHLASHLCSWGVFRCNSCYFYPCNPVACHPEPGMLTSATQAGPYLSLSPKSCWNFVCMDIWALSIYPYLKVCIDIQDKRICSLILKSGF